MTDLAKHYIPQDYEEDIYQKWEKSGAFKPSEPALAAGRQPFVIMLPPPNITGSLHLGHALQDTIMDILSRYHRLLGEPVLWLPGTDSAALPTNRVINDQLAKEGISRHDIGREAFLKRTDEWYKKTGSEILEQMKRLGCSCDWSRHRFTLDEQYVRAVNEAFIKYYEKGYIYRGNRIVNWDPGSQTTVSDLEIDWQTESTPFYYFQYGPFEIGTARPETKFSDKYVVIHPDDERYQEYEHGQELAIEWINGPITATVIKDEASDPNVGSGVMTITPWHSQVDFALAQKHHLDMEQIIDFSGKLLPVAGEFAGLTIAEARPKIVAKLQDKGLLVRIDENYEHNLALNDRGKGVLEPQVMRQWFINMDKLKAETIEVTEKELIKFVPPRWKKHFLEWMNNVYDWNINRQIWLGHRLPVWWKPGSHGSEHEEDNYVVALKKPPGEWEQDPDVLDTWFSSALWPMATLGWPDSTDDLARFYPSTVLVTARDIIYLWVARMIFSGLELMQGPEYGDRQQTDRIPFQNVFIHPTLLTKKGKRMSKSLGTGVDPLELIEKYGADATRFGLMYQMSYDNQAIRFDEEAIKSARNFANKIWNIARLLQSLPERSEKSLADEWISAKWQDTAAQVTQLLSKYKIGEATHLIYNFVWKDYADWYLEIIKIEGSTTHAKEIFTEVLRLMHPFMPYITEVLWQQLEQPGTLISATWPSLSQSAADNKVIQQMDRLQDIVSTTRQVRSMLAIAPQEIIQLQVDDLKQASIIARLTNAKIVASATSAMKKFSLSSGGHLAISAATLTPESVAAAVQKIAAEITSVTKRIEQQSAVVRAMRGKATSQALNDKQDHIKELKAKRDALTASHQALKS
ncbi:valine--tRNA ligase [Patescibacteria group bacterium]|nr:valine--tRNA ligase [Patescibacteria group bacterium]